VLAFLQTSGRNLFAAEAAAGVRHHVALSIVGTDRMPDNGYSPSHTNAKSAFIYATVLEGAIRSQVNDGPVTTYKAEQSSSELPGDRHGVSANASETKPAKLLAVFVVDTNGTELTIPFGN
jgi:quercetin dioxygenase-like cupin family protein